MSLTPFSDAVLFFRKYLVRPAPPPCDGKTWSISRWGYAPVPGPGLDVETSDFLYFQTI